MTINIADDIITGLTKGEILLEIAVLLYQREKISLGKAAKLAGMHRIAFQRELNLREIDIHYSVEDFDRDLKNLENIK